MSEKKAYPLRINADVLAAQPELAAQMQRSGERERLDVERHGAIRVGTAQELATLGRLFAVMGMQPVGYYDLTPAGVPVRITSPACSEKQPAMCWIIGTIGLSIALLLPS